MSSSTTRPWQHRSRRCCARWPARAAVPHHEQLAAIQAVVADRRRVLVVQRTGWGKSAVYFLATRLLRGAHFGVRGRLIGTTIGQAIMLVMTAIVIWAGGGAAAAAPRGCSAPEPAT